MALLDISAHAMKPRELSFSSRLRIQIRLFTCRRILIYKYILNIYCCQLLISDYKEVAFYVVIPGINLIRQIFIVPNLAWRSIIFKIAAVSSS